MQRPGCLARTLNVTDRDRSVRRRGERRMAETGGSIFRAEALARHLATRDASVAPRVGLPALARLFARRRQVPVVLQMVATECGAACLTMVLRHYGREISLAEARRQCGVGRDGTSIGTVSRMARTHGMRAKAISIEPADLA